MKHLPRWARVFAWAAGGIVLVVLVCNGWLLAANRARILRSVAATPARSVALVLGTAPRVGRWKNPFFEARMDAASALWRAGKARHLLVSGDNSRRDYDEPTAMRDALIALGASSADVPWRMSAKTRIREWLSRVKAVADVYVLRTKPRHLGDPVKLPLD
jgi:vancomycin permeability regulator SanA